MKHCSLAIKDGNGTRPHLSGWWYTYPSEKYESVGMIMPNIWKNNIHVAKPPISIYLINQY